MPLPMFDNKRQPGGVAIHGKPDLKVKDEVEVGKKIPKKLREAAENLLKVSKRESIVDMAKAIRKMKTTKKEKE